MQSDICTYGLVYLYYSSLAGVRPGVCLTEVKEYWKSLNTAVSGCRFPSTALEAASWPSTLALSIDSATPLFILWCLTLGALQHSQHHRQLSCFLEHQFPATDNFTNLCKTIRGRISLHHGQPLFNTNRGGRRRRRSKQCRDEGWISKMEARSRKHKTSAMLINQRTSSALRLAMCRCRFFAAGAVQRASCYSVPDMPARRSK